MIIKSRPAQNVLDRTGSTLSCSGQPCPGWKPSGLSEQNENETHPWMQPPNFSRESDREQLLGVVRQVPSSASLPPAVHVSQQQRFPTLTPDSVDPMMQATLGTVSFVHFVLLVMLDSLKHCSCLCFWPCLGVSAALCVPVSVCACVVNRKYLRALGGTDIQTKTAVQHPKIQDAVRNWGTNSGTRCIPPPPKPFQNGPKSPATPNKAT